MRRRIALQSTSCEIVKAPIQFREALGVGRVLASLKLLPPRFLELFADLVFLVAKVLQMTLEQW